MNDLQGKCEVMAYKTAYPVIAGLLILAFLMSGSMAAPQQKGVVYVNSVPEGAEIYLTNVSVTPDNLTVSDTEGLTPREFFVDPGTYRLFLKKYGFITWWNESFTVSPGTYLNFTTVTLTPNNPVYGAIHLDTNPSDADLTLHREIPNVTSLIYSKTPASVESLPPGTYIYNITRTGYYPKNGTTEVTAGNVTELRLTLDPIPETAPVTFRSEPTNADVFIWKLDSSLDAATQAATVSKVESALSGFTGTYEEATAKVDNLVSSEMMLPDEMKFTNGAIGNTTTTQQLYQGSYLYLFFKDRYYPKIGIHNVTASVPSSVEVQLIPYTNFVQVYFETNVDDDDHPDLGIPKGATVTYDGIVQENRTPCWISLPAQKIVNVTFDRMPMNVPTTVTIDTTLFVGRPSKWGQIINLDRATYFIQASSDAHSTIQPNGLIPVLAGETMTFNLSGEHPAYLVHNLTVNRISEGIPEFNITYDLDSITYPHEKTLGNATLFVSSKKKQVAVNATAGKGGSVNNAGITLYDYGNDSVPYNFVPNTDYQVKQLWEDGLPVPYAPSYIIQGSRMTYNHTLYCTFRPTKVWIFANSTEGGRIEPSTPYMADYGGCTQNTTAIAEPGYYLKDLTWDEEEGDPYMSSAEGFTTSYYKCNLKSNLTWHAVFDKQWFNISASATEGGMIVPSGNSTATYGQNLSFTSTAFSGFRLAEIIDNGVSKGPVSPYNLSVTENHEIIANFRPDVLTITAVAGQGGIIEPNGTVNVTFGNTQCFNITANSNYFISSVEVDGSDLGNKTSPFNYCFPNVTTNHSINASFQKYAYTITPSAGDGGSINPSIPQNVTIGGSANFTITADTCHTISNVIVDGASLGPQTSPYNYSFANVTADHTIHGDFQIKTYNILVNQSNGGTIAPAGTNGIVQVNCGASQTFTMTPDTGNALYDVIVDNSSVGVINPYTFLNISSDHTIEPVFVIPPEPDFEADRTRVPPRYPVTFKDFTKNNPTDWLWDFGDGEVSNVREPVHYYASVGNYTVKLTAFNAAALGGISIEKKDYIQVTTDPIACFIAKPLGGTVPPGLSVEFTDCSLNTDGVAWGWVFGDGEQGSLSKNTTHTYTAPGVYQVTHQVEKPFIAKDYAYETITVFQKPVADFIAHPVSGKSPLSVQFEDKSQGFPTEWFWNFGDNTASYDQNPLHVYAGTGNYTVTLKVFSDEGTSEKIKEGFITVQ